MDALRFYKDVDELVGKDKCADVQITVSIVSVKVEVSFHTVGRFYFTQRYPKDTNIAYYALKDIKKAYNSWLHRHPTLEL